ncbi:MAG: 7-cyano-7-deazaguanine synthase QueC [archaeon]|nr:7-cyano-7-deazaguanine synthase QueC [archaeon]
MKKVVLILSGGLDSSTLLYYLINKEYEVNALSFNYGQKGHEELKRASKICELNNVKHKVIDIQNIVEVFSKSSLTSAENTNTNSPKDTVVPSRNTILLSLATAYAISNDCKEVYYGAIADDVGDYPDTTLEFLESMNELNKVNNYEYIPIKAPFVKCSKEEVVKKALELDVPIDLTFSCYQPKEDGSPCNECISCRSRITAIENVKKSMQND